MLQYRPAVVRTVFTLQRFDGPLVRPSSTYSTEPTPIRPDDHNFSLNWHGFPSSFFNNFKHLRAARFNSLAICSHTTVSRFFNGSKKQPLSRTASKIPDRRGSTRASSVAKSGAPDLAAAAASAVAAGEKSVPKAAKPLLARPGTREKLPQPSSKTRAGGARARGPRMPSGSQR